MVNIIISEDSFDQPTRVHEKIAIEFNTTRGTQKSKSQIKVGT